MGYVLVISFPVILFFLIVALAFYLLGRARGRREAPSVPVYYGPPAPPFQAHRPEEPGKTPEP
ncbi:hypothetical protein HS088_TW03G00737 [Tripterygium wilfordii]|uniref:Transmembrane protein n=1 Tax=Tripterygium wilfordii TaxID=458696 RepID=A0A7J7DVS4_TRIWF|nr:hypothetical protein HS088_TW03G00737 [Tripterygium wilfordii]